MTLPCSARLVPPFGHAGTLAVPDLWGVAKR
jgi:hypothetical protein